MDYEKRYKEALKWMQSLYGGLHGATKEEAEKYFPELKESDYEKVKRIIYSIVTKMSFHVHDIFTEEEFQCFDAWCHTWLEKQGEKATHINGEDYGIDGLYHAIKILERTVGRVTGYQSDDGILSHEAAIDAVKELYEKQGEQKHFSDFKAKDWYVSKVDGKIHNMTYNPTDKVEPKFHEGEWITDGRLTCKVLGVTGKSYELHLHNDDYCHFETDIQSVDKYYRLWTIEDAKDGDVLVSKDNRPFIFTGEFDVQNDNPTAYCGINSNDKFITGKGSHWTFKDGIKPATKEQRELLFSKMKEAGYEWDSEKKELKKMEAASKESEDERMLREIKRYIKEQGDKPTGLSNGTVPVSDMITWLEKQGEPKDKEEISDGYHTFNELCRYRMLYNAECCEIPLFDNPVTLKERNLL